MLTLRIGVSLTMLREPLRAAMRTAASLGVRGVLLDARQGVRPEELSETGLRQFRKLLEDYNLRVAAVAFPTRRGYGVSEDLDRRVEATKQVMLFARQLGTDVVINQIGQVPTDESSTTWQTLVQVLTDLGNFSNRAGAFLTAKTGSEPAADLARLLAALPEGSIGVDLDPGQLVMNGFSSLEAAELLGQYVRHVTVNDAVRDLGIGRGTEVQIGRGVVDWPALLGALEEHDYRGWLTIERRNAEEPARECAEAVEYLENL